MRISRQLWDDLVTFFDNFYDRDFDQVEAEVKSFQRRLANVERKALQVRPMPKKERA